MEILIAIILATLAIQHVDETPVKNLYSDYGGTVTITGEALPVAPIGFADPGSKTWYRFDSLTHHYNGPDQDGTR
jgi:hypothetical protein